MAKGDGNASEPTSQGDEFRLRGIQERDKGKLAAYYRTHKSTLE